LKELTMKHRGLFAAVLALLAASVSVDAGKGPKPPYCADRCAGWRPCNKLCRLADETVVTCGKYGLCQPPDPAVGDEEPPACANDAPRCERDGRSYCPAVPGFLFRAASSAGTRVRFAALTEGVTADTEITWKFGQALAPEAVGPVVYHVYPAAGKYPVTLEVTESVCQTQQSRTVTINVPPDLEVPALLPTPMPSPGSAAALPH
jgi:PKD domain